MLVAMAGAPPFRYLLRVRYGECDAQKIVYNARYGDYVDLAATEFLRAIWGKDLFGGGLDYRLVRFAIDWRSPARYDDVLAIDVHTSRIGTTSFVLRMDLLRKDGGEAIATAETTYVLVGEADQRKRPLPDENRRRLEHGAPGVVVDHAGAGR
jgi:acyl-CoA thioester hydrolase